MRPFDDAHGRPFVRTFVRAVLVLGILQAGCGAGLPRLAPSGEPLAAYLNVPSGTIAPRTLLPVEEPKASVDESPAPARETEPKP